MRWNSAKHFEITVPWSGWLRKEFPKEPLFVYRHKKWGTFVIAKWIQQDTRLFQEVLVVGTRPSEFDSLKAEALKLILGVSQKEVRAAAKEDVRAEERALDRAVDQDAEEFEDMHKFLHKHAHQNRLKEHPLVRVLAGLSEA